MVPDLICTDVILNLICTDMVSNPASIITITITMNDAHTYKLSNRFIACNLIIGNHFIRFNPSFPIHIYVESINDIVNKHI